MPPTLPQTISATRMLLEHGYMLDDAKRAELRAFLKTAVAVEAQRPDSWFRSQMAALKLRAAGVRA